MTKIIRTEGERFVEDYEKNAALLEAAGIDTTPHDACGVGLVAAWTASRAARWWWPGSRR